MDRLLSFLRSSPSLEQVDSRSIQIEREVARMQDEIRLLAEYKNTRLIGVSKVPSEVLLLVFELLVLNPAPPPKRGIWRPYTDILSATQTCHSWRQIALDSPRIWSFIYGSVPLPLVTLFLERAKSAPLCFWAPYDRLRGANVATVFEHLEHLKEITLDVPFQPEWLQYITSTPAPQLEILSVRNKQFDSESSTSFTGSAGLFPSLRHLSLDGYIWKMDASCLRALHSLKLRFLRIPGLQSDLPEAVAFFASLDNLPLLSSLTLDSALSPPTATPSRSVSLPRLTKLVIRDRDLAIPGMAAHIDMPRIEEMDLSSSGPTDSETAAPILSAIYSNLLTPGEFSSELQLDIGVSSFAQITLRKKEDLETELAVVTLLPQAFRPSHLYFSSDVEEFSDDPWFISQRNILRKLVDVTEVSVESLPDLLLILRDTPPQPGPMSLPCMKKVVVGQTLEDEEPVAMFKALLEARKAVNAAIECCVLDTAHLSHWSLDGLKSLIPCLEELGTRDVNT
ncbi:F-box domain-containing protein [Pleurotus pulmonarius]